MKENDVRYDNFDDKDPRKEPFHSFALPEDDYGEAMTAKRINPAGSQSPPALPQSESSGSASGTRRQSTIEDTEGKPPLFEFSFQLTLTSQTQNLPLHLRPGKVLYEVQEIDRGVARS